MKHDEMVTTTRWQTLRDVVSREPDASFSEIHNLIMHEVRGVS